ncbi:MAG: molybdopterin-dependent oxidoreductase, partial [Chloroflexota bacterium]
MSGGAAVRTHSAHWGAVDAIVGEDGIAESRPFAGDPVPSPLLGNIASSLRSSSRVAEPKVRSGCLERGPGPDARRGAEPFVAVGWDAALALLAAEYRRVYGEFGPGAVYGGSYGWASAGRFHHAQSQIHRFLNALGGYVRSVDNYSFAAGDVILRRVAAPAYTFAQRATGWESVAESTGLLVAFGGLSMKNIGVSPGGASSHRASGFLRQAVGRGMEVVSISPVRDDAADWLGAEWIAPVPGTDVALMLGAAYVLLDEGLHDRDFLDRCCAGVPEFTAYVQGRADGVPKTPAWAEAICGIPAERIAALARRMAGSRTLINVNWSLQRSQHGEQPPWMGLALASLLGQVGLPGGGFGFSYGSMAQVGEPPVRGRLPVLSQLENPVPDFIPVARVADMLLGPGEPFRYDGRDLVYPDIRLVTWAGGNPFHHHQDLGRLRRAFARPETIVVHDPFWTATARHADIVLPSTVSLERDDIGAASNDRFLTAMQQAALPFARARNDYETLSEVAAALGAGDRFTEGRTAAEWVRFLYDEWREARIARDVPTPGFEEFWALGRLELEREEGQVLFAGFRADPAAHPLDTPSGRIELHSAQIAALGLDDCPGHPTWLDKRALPSSADAARHPLVLVANNPRTRLHSQLDCGDFSRSSKIRDREPARLNPDDAARRGIRGGDVIRVFNDRGSCLAGAVLDDAVRPGVIQLSTGAWYDPLDPADPGSMCVHGNPNVLTSDDGDYRLSQGCSGQHALVEAEPWTAPLPPVRAFLPPPAAGGRAGEG